MTLPTESIDSFLASTVIIDWRAPVVLQHARRLRDESAGALDYVRRAFEWVRDEIRHTGDHQLDPVTCTASEAALHGAGYCYAKSHLLAALCRAEGIPAGLGYQRLCLDEARAVFCLHGFAVVRLPGGDWRRLDPRGNRPDLATQFQSEADCLAFTPSTAGERTFTAILAEPLDVVVRTLRRYRLRADLERHFPDQAEVEGWGECGAR